MNPRENYEISVATAPGKSMTNWLCLIIALAVGFCSVSVPCAADESATVPSGGSQDLEFFEKEIRPILADHCAKCHGDSKQKGGLRVDSKQALLQGGDSGPAIVPGSAEKSLLVEAIHQTGDVSMPPKSRLSESDIARVSEWIQRGAPWPDSPTTAGKPGESPAAPGLTEAQRKWWAFQPVRPVAPPAVNETANVRNPIDRFLEHEFETRHLTPLGPADKRALLRRATFDLIGLPPSPEEIAAFLADDAPDAFDRVVNRLLASPHYGEHWGRRWLDVARYTDYLNGNNPSPQEYAEAYRYRDWVVAALNQDLPYDQFVEAQIAGDLIPGAPIAATGALAIGVYDNADSDKNKIVSDIVADQIDFVGKAFLGLTLACARCHDHKFDPISQRDYYGLAGIFYSSRALARLGKPGLAVDFLRPALEGDEYGARYASLDTKLKSVQAELKKIGEPTALASSRNAGAGAGAGAAASASPAPQAAEPATSPPAPGIPDDTEQKRERLAGERTALQRQLDEMRPPTYAMAIEEGGVPGSLFPGMQDVPLHIRGSYARLGAVVPRGFPRIIAGENSPVIAHGSGRLELARWLASAENPLTARVMVNRVWQGHFGEGLVRTANNFGKLGEAPSNAALLDWLAAEFIESGWSIKAMHRLIMASAAYQRAALHDAEHGALIESDPENRTLARFPTRRLEAEEIRDAMLSAAGSLDPTPGGPATADVRSARRSLYVATTRNNRSNFSTLFDAADPELCVEKRDVSTVAPQALFFLNSPFVHAEAAALAKRLLDASNDESARIDRAYELLYGRPADKQEHQIGMEFLGRRKTLGAEEAWTDYAHTLLCANEFLTLD
jgi:Protein of unknown function (DUF1553)/Protein of unknown function (DUF1549)/Planctomycete cytochrome C